MRRNPLKESKRPAGDRRVVSGVAVRRPVGLDAFESPRSRGGRPARRRSARPSARLGLARRRPSAARLASGSAGRRSAAASGSSATRLRPRRPARLGVGSASSASPASASATRRRLPRRGSRPRRRRRPRPRRGLATRQSVSGLGCGLVGRGLHRRGSASAAGLHGLGASPRLRRDSASGRLGSAAGASTSAAASSPARPATGRGLAASLGSAICWRTWANAAASVLSIPPSGSWTASLIGNRAPGADVARLAVRRLAARPGRAPAPVEPAPPRPA